jgi:hypothetical protein
VRATTTWYTQGWHIRQGSVQALFLKPWEKQGQQKIEAIEGWFAVV